MRIVSLRVPDWFVWFLDLLVERGYYICRSEALRAAIRALMRELKREGIDVNELIREANKYAEKYSKE